MSRQRRPRKQVYPPNTRLSINDLECNSFAKQLLSNDKLLLYDLQESTENAYVPSKQDVRFSCHGVFNNVIEYHQIAHMVEMSKLERCLQSDWGMAFDNRTHTNKQFLRGMTREIKVRAIQSLISGSEIKFVKDRLSFLNMYWENGVKSRLPFGKFKSYDEVKDWEYSFAQATVKHWDRDRIENEWNKKMDFISNWMESK